VTDVLGVTHSGHPWVSPLVVALFGFVLVALGLLLERGRRAGVGPPAPVDDLHNMS
jgi:H+/Cl- antiporter ClcA